MKDARGQAPRFLKKSSHQAVVKRNDIVWKHNILKSKLILLRISHEQPYFCVLQLYWKTALYTEIVSRTGIQTWFQS